MLWKKPNEYTFMSIPYVNVTYVVCFRILFPKTEIDTTLSTKSTSFLIVRNRLTSQTDPVLTWCKGKTRKDFL